MTLSTPTTISTPSTSWRRKWKLLPTPWTSHKRIRQLLPVRVALFISVDFIGFGVSWRAGEEASPRTRAPIRYAISPHSQIHNNLSGWREGQMRWECCAFVMAPFAL